MGEIRPYLCADDAHAALAWYVAAMGATVVFEPIVMDDGRIGHAELSFDGARVMMSDSYPELRATVDRGPEDSDHGRTAVFRDPFGHRWMLGAPGS